MIPYRAPFSPPSSHMSHSTEQFQMPTVTGQAFVPNQFSYFQALQAACKTKNAAKAKEVSTPPII